jgi:carboxymethylenebutenolidase
MIETAIEIPTPDGAADGFLTQPEKAGHWPGVLDLTYIVGIDDASRSMASRLAAEGYAVLLPNIFYRNGKPPIFNFPFKIGDERFLRRMDGIRGPLTPDATDRNLSAYVDFLARRPSVRGEAFGVVGFGFSAQMALRAAATRSDQMRCIIRRRRPLHRRTDSPHTLLSRVKAHLYFGHGAEDRSMPQEVI